MHFHLTLFSSVTKAEVQQKRLDYIKNESNAKLLRYMTNVKLVTPAYTGVHTCYENDV